MLTWAGIHIWLIRDRIGDSNAYHFLVENLYDHLYNSLISKWLPEASIPSFSIKSEGKLLVDEVRDFVSSMNEKNMREHIQTRCYVPLGISETDPVLSELVNYIQQQERMLAEIDLKHIIQNPTSWQWDDTIE
jgi:hypothetical protein